MLMIECFTTTNYRRYKLWFDKSEIPFSKTLVFLANSTPQSSNTILGLCFPFFQQEGKPRALAHVFSIGLQFQIMGQWLVRSTFSLTSAPTLCLVTSVCTHMFRCSYPANTKLDPPGSVSCAASP